MSKEQFEKVKQIIENNWDSQLATLKDLIAIESVAGEADNTSKMPFGEGVHRAFSYVLDKAEEMGFETENVDNYGGHIEFGGYIYEDGVMVGTSEEVFGIAGHLDTVPLGDRKEWTHDPLACEIDDGLIYGRGVLDDKGPVVASLYAMKALKEAGVEPETKVRLILGLDEETGWSGMDRYLEEVKAPDFGFTPDADFPVINGEKGVLFFQMAKKFGKSQNEGLELRSISGGAAANMVADKARAVVMSKNKDDYERIKTQADLWAAEGRADVSTRIMGKSMEIAVKGISAHGSLPDMGVNAISKLMAFLGGLNFANDDMTDFIEFYNAHVAEETDGKSLGCDLKDDISGGTIVNIGLIELDAKAVSVTLNIRYPITCKSEEIYDGIIETCNKYDVGIVKGMDQKPIYMEEDSHIIKTLMDVYKEHTGDEDAKPMVIGGGTYARAFDDFVAFGACFPESDDCAHQADEHLKLEDLKKMTIIYADAIYRLGNCEKD